MTTRKNWKCSECGELGFLVRKTYCKHNYTLRWVRCTNCNYDIFTKEVIIDKSETVWKTINAQTVLELRLAKKEIMNNLLE